MITGSDKQHVSARQLASVSFALPVQNGGGDNSHLSHQTTPLHVSTGSTLQRFIPVRWICVVTPIHIVTHVRSTAQICCCTVVVMYIR